MQDWIYFHFWCTCCMILYVYKCSFVTAPTEISISLCTVSVFMWLKYCIKMFLTAITYFNEGLGQTTPDLFIISFHNLYCTILNITWTHTICVHIHLCIRFSFGSILHVSDEGVDQEVVTSSLKRSAHQIAAIGLWRTTYTKSSMSLFTVNVLYSDIHIQNCYSPERKPNKVLWMKVLFIFKPNNKKEIWIP